MNVKNLIRMKNLFLLLLLIGTTLLNSCTNDDLAPDSARYVPEQPAAEQWKFKAKVMISRDIYDKYYKSVDVVNQKLTAIFKQVKDYYRGINGVRYFTADIIFEPCFDESCIFDGSADQFFKYTKGGFDFQGEKVPYLILFKNTNHAGADFTPGTNWNIVRYYYEGGDCLSSKSIARTMAHELGHGRGVPDIYYMEVKTNEVNGKQYMPVECMMNNCWGNIIWSEYSQLLIDRNKNLSPNNPDFYDLNKVTLPNTLHLKVQKDSKPVSGLTVNIYKCKFDYKCLLTNKIYHTAKLDANGSSTFSMHDLFLDQTELKRPGINYGTILIEVINGTQKTYQWLCVTDAQTSYMKGNRDVYELNMKID